MLDTQSPNCQELRLRFVSFAEVLLSNCPSHRKRGRYKSHIPNSVPKVEPNNCKEGLVLRALVRNQNKPVVKRKKQARCRSSSRCILVKTPLGTEKEPFSKSSSCMGVLRAGAPTQASDFTNFVFWGSWEHPARTKESGV